MRLLITGSTGALGRALLAQLTTDPAVTRLVCYSRSESRQAEVAASLPDHPALRWTLGDVRDRERLTQAMLGCETVIHAAANKKVDASAYAPSETLATNVVGTQNVIAAALDAGVQRVLFISSDKAPNAANIYGASKFMGEHLIIAANSYTAPRNLLCACTRWGNVLGSTGSVLLLWKAAMAAGEPIAVTHPQMTRFLLRLDHAAAFALHALAIMRGGEILIPELPAASLGALADAFAPTYRQKIIGLRAGGEKMDEVLCTPEEATRTVQAEPGVWAINPSIHHWRIDAPWVGDPWPADRIYRSDQVRQLTVAEIRELIHG